MPRGSAFAPIPPPNELLFLEERRIKVFAVRSWTALEYESSPSGVRVIRSITLRKTQTLSGTPQFRI